MATDKNYIIGYKDSIPWHLPEDLKHFKDTTWGHNVFMGRKTFESLPVALSGRTSHVLTSQADYLASDSVFVYNDREAFIRYAMIHGGYVIGGSEIYNMFAPFVDRLIVTSVNFDTIKETGYSRIEDGDFTIFDYNQLMGPHERKRYVSDIMTSKNGLEYTIQVINY